MIGSENLKNKLTIIRKDVNKASKTNIQPIKEKVAYTDYEYLMNRGKLLLELFKACSLKGREI